MSGRMLCGHDQIADQCPKCTAPADPTVLKSEYDELKRQLYHSMKAHARTCEERDSRLARVDRFIKTVRGLVYFKEGSGVTLYDVQLALEELEGKRTDV